MRLSREPRMLPSTEIDGPRKKARDSTARVAAYHCRLTSSAWSWCHLLQSRRGMISRSLDCRLERSNASCARQLSLWSASLMFAWRTRSLHGVPRLVTPEQVPSPRERTCSHCHSDILKQNCKYFRKSTNYMSNLMMVKKKCRYCARSRLDL